MGGSALHGRRHAGRTMGVARLSGSPPEGISRSVAYHIDLRSRVVGSSYPRAVPTKILVSQQVTPRSETTAPRDRPSAPALRLSRPTASAVPGIGESIARRVMELRENGVARQAPERRYQHRLHPPLL